LNKLTPNRHTPSRNWEGLPRGFASLRRLALRSGPICVIRFAHLCWPCMATRTPVAFGSSIATRRSVKHGFEPIPSWQSCYWHGSLRLLLVVYVDDFKPAGPSKAVVEGWRLIRLCHPGR
jgi:hypothetical protein